IVQQRRRPALRFLARGLPVHLAVAPVEGGNVGTAELVSHKYNRIPGQNRGSSQTHRIHKGTELNPPSQVAGRVIRNQAEILEKHVHVFAVANRGDGRRAVQEIPILLISPIFRALPNELAGLAIKALREQFFLFEPGQEYVARSKYRRGLTWANRCSPDRVLVLAKLYREAGILRYPGAIRTPKARPVFRP